MGATNEMFKHPHSIQWVPCTKWIGHEEYFLSPSKAKVKNEWGCTSTSPTCLEGADRGNFAFCSKCFQNGVYGLYTKVNKYRKDYRMVLFLSVI
jgi:hypothetical protein